MEFLKESTVTCNNDIEVVAKIRDLFLIPVQHHRLHIATIKSTGIGINVTLNIWMLRAYDPKAEEKV